MPLGDPNKVKANSKCYTILGAGYVVMMAMMLLEILFLQMMQEHAGAEAVEK